MLKLAKVLFISSAVVLATGCASIVTDDSAFINVSTSTGEQIKVTVDGQEYNAPGLITVAKTGTDKIIVAESDNCDRETVAVKEIETAFWGNILTGGLLGSTTDSATNKMWTYSESVTVNCR
jgi:hypothetical protein|tara:strand:- start:3038 stop:3403 length:366 start_codon:yes stop_codon:yes gene_type:complete